MTKTVGRIFLLGVVVLVGLGVTGFGAVSRAAVDDGYYDRWSNVIVTYDGVSDTIFVSYHRDWVHPPTGTITPSFVRTDPLPQVQVLSPWAPSALSGQTGSGNFLLGTNVPTETVAPGTYLLRRDITLTDGTLTYRQDIVITLSAPNPTSGVVTVTVTSVEDLFVPADIAETPPATAPAPVVVAAETTG